VDEARPPARDRRRIDVRAYTSKLQSLLTSWTDTPDGADYNDKDLTASLQALWSGDPDRRIVFFGAGYGQEDTYLTPVGTLYGVEVHAAAFWSGEQSSLRTWLSPVAAVLVEIGFAFVFGFIIARCWRRYFAWRLEAGSAHEQLAAIWIAIMLCGLLVAIAIASFVSFGLLRWGGLWLSPIPVAVGMLIEGCMLGSVEAAIRQLRRIQTDPTARTLAVASIAGTAGESRIAIWLLRIRRGVALRPVSFRKE
jgi:hypothetical protein